MAISHTFLLTFRDAEIMRQKQLKALEAAQQQQQQKK